MNDVPRGLLRETLRGRMTPERGAGCLDSQTLAAWSEGTLRARDREAIEEHASDCARCQALLAAMVTTAPTIAPSRWWRPSRLALRSFGVGGGWLAPIAAAAAAILLWINVPRSAVDRAAMPPAAMPSAATPSAATPSAATPSAATTAKPDTPATSPIPSPSSAPPEAAARRPVETSAQARAKIARDASPSPASQRALRPDDRAAAAIPQAKGALEPAADPPVAGKILPAQTRDAASAASAVPPPAGIAPVPVLPRAEPVTTTSKFADAAKVEAASGARAGAGGGGRGGGGGGIARLTAAPPEIVSPDASVRWRILSPGRVIRSTDRGATWQEQSTGVPVALTAGAAPSPKTCWLVGASGTIVLSTDGLTWQRVAFPETIDLTAVRASDGSNATVTAADGRTFTTTDGGKSWRQP